MFVTGLQFLPVTNEEGPPISSDTEAAVLSISVDNKVCIHSLQHRRMYSHALNKTKPNNFFLIQILFYRYHARLVSNNAHCFGAICCIYSMLISRPVEKYENIIRTSIKLQL